MRTKTNTQTETKYSNYKALHGQYKLSIITLEGRHASFLEESRDHFYHDFPQDKQIAF